MGETKHLSNVVNGKPEKPSDSEAYSEREARFERRRKLTVALWARGSQFFGGLWEATYGSVNDQTIYSWQGALSRLTEEQLACGVRKMEKWEGKYPPTFGQFRALCTSNDSAPSNAIPVSNRLTKQNDPETMRLVIDREMAKIRKGMETGEWDETQEDAMHNLGLNRR